MKDRASVLSPDMPLFTGRSFNHTKRTNGRSAPTSVTATRSGDHRDRQVGTQLDMFAHQGIDGCLQLREDRRDGDAHRLQDARRREIGALFARGVLVDVAARRTWRCPVIEIAGADLAPRAPASTDAVAERSPR
jgi:hypothetical protein